MLTKKDNVKEEKTTKTSKSVTSTSRNNKAACCPPPVKQETFLPAKTTSKQQNEKEADSKTVCSKSRITIKYDVGFSNQLYIRGKGANLSWEKGQILKNIKSDEWTWETDDPFTQCEFKVLINDQVYENGDNHQLKSGDCLSLIPNFHS